MILFNIFSEIRSWHKLLFYIIGIQCLRIMLLGRNVLISSNLLLGRNLMVLKFKLLLCLKGSPCRPLILPARNLLNSRQLPKIRHYLFIIYGFVGVRVFVVYIHLLTTLHNISHMIVDLCEFLDFVSLFTSLIFPGFMSSL